MNLLVLGSSGTYPSPGGACNSYLLQSNSGSLLIDLGPGSLSRLFKWRDPADVDAVFISHLHPDHFLDIYPYRYYLQFSANESKLPVNIFAPSGAKDRILPLFSDQNISGFEKVFSWHDLQDGVVLKVNNWRIIPREVPHLPPTYSLVVEDSYGKRLFYTADTAYDDKLAEWAEGADIFLCEASLRSVDAGKAAHLTGAQAGQIAEKAKVGRLILTHLWPHNDVREILNEARLEFSGAIDLAEDEKLYELEPQ